MTENLVRLECRDSIATLWLNRPEQRNALNRPLIAELRRHLKALEDDERVRAVVITGTGDKAFAAGADINQLAGSTPVDALGAWLQRFFDYVERYPKPTIAAVNGFALGGGCELAMSCDLRIAGDSARFGLPETTLGIIPGAGGTQRLSRLIGTGRAMDMILTGRIITAEAALAAGLVTEVTSEADLLKKAHATAAGIMSKGPLAVRLAKMVVRQGADADQATGLMLERLAQALAYSSEDKAEGTRAFIDKRPADFIGR